MNQNQQNHNVEKGKPDTAARKPKFRLINLPNTITCCNLVSGAIATVYALMCDPEMTLLWIVIGAVFDFFDGMTARLTHQTSPIGKELDSLADDITFGLAPSALIFCLLSKLDYPSWLGFAADVIPYLAFIMAAFSALRLAKFNLDERQSLGFIGLPTPANALFWVSLIVGVGDMLATSQYSFIAVLVLEALSCWLLISEIPMFALKFKHWGWKENELKYVFVLTCIPIIAIFRWSAFAVVIAWYVVLSVCVDLKMRR